MQNGFVKNFNSRLQNDCLNEPMFSSLRQVRKPSNILQSPPTAFDPWRAEPGRGQKVKSIMGVYLMTLANTAYNDQFFSKGLYA